MSDRFSITVGAGDYEGAVNEDAIINFIEEVADAALFDNDNFLTLVNEDKNTFLQLAFADNHFIVEYSPEDCVIFAKNFDKVSDVRNEFLQYFAGEAPNMNGYERTDF